MDCGGLDTRFDAVILPHQALAASKMITMHKFALMM